MRWVLTGKFADRLMHSLPLPMHLLKVCIPYITTVCARLLVHCTRLIARMTRRGMLRRTSGTRLPQLFSSPCQHQELLARSVSFRVLSASVSMRCLLHRGSTFLALGTVLR